MFGMTNERRSKNPMQTVHGFASEGNLALQVRPASFGESSAGLPVPETVHFRGGLPPCVVRRVREHIDANISQRVKIETLAKLANLSVCYFVRALKQSVGVPPHGYLMRRRVERTLELLSRTDMSISEIALAAGFSDQSHCARRFRQHVGVSPRDYRLAMR